jgi:alpha-tubulin suppressor-like RCC1 family protein
MSWPARIGTIAQRSTVSNKVYGAGYNFFGELATNRAGVRNSPSVDTRYTTGSIWVSGSSNDTFWSGLINTNKRYFIRTEAFRQGGDPYNNILRVGTGSNWIKSAGSRNSHYAIDGTNKNVWYNSNALNGASAQFSKVSTGSFSDIRCGPDNMAVPSLLALNTNGTLWGYGTNVYGELGDNTVVFKSSFVKIGTNTWTDFDINYHSLAVRSNGTLWGWGYNGYGQVGDNTIINRSSPVQIGTGTTWRQVSCGEGSIFSRFRGHSGAIKTDNTLWMWGSNDYGQLGQNNTTDRSSPVQVGTGTDWSAVMCGRNATTFALKTNGTLWAWGSNGTRVSDGWPTTYPQLGTGDYIHRSSPVQIGTGSNWTKLVFGSRGNPFAINTNKQLWMWGATISGDSGGNNVTASNSPTLIDSTNNFVKVQSVGNVNQIYGPTQQPVVALKSDGTLWNWGALIGAGTLTSTEMRFRSSPVQIGTGSNWTRNYSLWSPAFGFNGDAEVSCMFINSSGQLWRIASDIKRVTTGSNWTWVVSMGNTSNQIAGQYMCLQSNGTRWGFGWNPSGEMGIGSTASVGSNGSPVRLDSATNWSRLYTGYFSCFGIKTDGTLWAWGRNQDYGQLGLGDLINRSSPTQVGTGTNWRLVAPGYLEFAPTLAIKTDGTLWAWGYNGFSGLAQGNQINRSSPVQIGTGTNWVSASSGPYSTCFALKSDGTLWGWGLGDTFRTQSMRTSTVASPVQIGGLTTWKDVTQGAWQTYLVGTL